MRVALPALAALVLALTAAPATAQVSRQTTPDGDIKAHEPNNQSLTCYYYQPGTTAVSGPYLGPEQRRAAMFAKVDKWDLNAQTYAYEGEPGLPEPAPAQESLFAAAEMPVVAEKWNLTQTPTQFPTLFAAPGIFESAPMTPQVATSTSADGGTWPPCGRLVGGVGSLRCGRGTVKLAHSPRGNTEGNLRPLTNLADATDGHGAATRPCGSHPRLKNHVSEAALRGGTRLQLWNNQQSGLGTPWA